MAPAMQGWCVFALCVCMCHSNRQASLNRRGQAGYGLAAAQWANKRVSRSIEDKQAHSALALT
eukprot:1139485-Pelagomonas_calceolata.AAC.1